MGKPKYSEEIGPSTALSELEPGPPRWEVIE
jgi:hypothetical protein